jgi:hypothetical protein
MSIYDESVKQHLDLWQAEFVALPPPMDIDDSEVSVESARREMEALQLALEVEYIHQKVEALDFQTASSYHTLPRQDGYVAVYISRTSPKGQPPSDQYVRIIRNEVTSTETFERTAIIDEYYVDLENRCLRSYHGIARSDSSSWTIPDESPTLIFQKGADISLSAGNNYRPSLPPVPDDSATFEDMNLQRQEAVVLVGVLEQLGEVSLDFKFPYET